jgi:hypothetical protein
MIPTLKPPTELNLNLKHFNCQIVIKKLEHKYGIHQEQNNF